MKRGFTLIELLVVVLIIGILSAVALPQYQQVVMKARIAQVIPLVRSLAKAQRVYYLKHGRYAETVEKLGVRFSCPDGWTCVVHGSAVDPSSEAPKVEVARTKGKNIGVIYYYGTPNKEYYKDQFYCWAKQTDELAVETCKSFGPPFEIDSQYARYLIQ